MMVTTDVLATLHSVLLVGFLSVTLLLLLVTLINRVRVQRAVLSWRPPRLGGVPLWPSCFMATVLLLLALASIVGQPVRPEIFAGYLLGGLCWFIASWLSASVVITEYGIVRNINRSADTVAWGQAVDYFSHKEGARSCYVFFFIDNQGGRQRFELWVPLAYQKRFQHVVTAKLDARFEFSMRQAYGKKALEG